VAYELPLRSGPDIFRTRSPRKREVHAVSLRPETAVPPAELVPVRSKEAHSAERGTRLTGTLLVVVGALLLALAAGDALADAELGGAGDDFIEAKDGHRDYVWCGPGDDVVSVDLGDRVARNCETLYPA